MSRSLTVSGVVPALPPISSTSAPAGTDSMRSVPTCKACASSVPLTTSASMAAPAYRRGHVGRKRPCMSERRVKAEQDVVLAAQVAREVGTGGPGLVEEIDVDLDDALDVAHKVIRRGEAEAVAGDPFVNGIGSRKVACRGVVVQRRVGPAVVRNPVDPGEPAVPSIVARGIDVQKPVPAIPQILGVPVRIAADVAGGIEADDALVGIALALVHARRSGGSALLAGGAEQSHPDRSDVHANMGKDGLGAVVVEHPVGAGIARAVELEVVLDAVAVRNAEIDAEGSDLAVEQHTAVVGDPGHAIDHEVLERQAYLARKHRVGERELAQHHADAAAQDVGVAEPGILDHDLAVAALLGHDGVEVVGDVLAQRSAG